MNERESRRTITTSFYSFVAATDTTAPCISNVSADSTTESSTVITWVTDEAATGEVQYGTSADALNASTDLNTNLNVNHSTCFPVSGLEPNTTYYFKVISKDGGKNASESEVNSFTTLRSAEFQHDPLSEIKNVSFPLPPTRAPSLRSIPIGRIVSCHYNWRKLR